MSGSDKFASFSPHPSLSLSLAARSSPLDARRAAFPAEKRSVELEERRALLLA